MLDVIQAHQMGPGALYQRSFMIQIEINRWTIMKLEETMDKYNSEHPYSIHEYVDMINKLLELYLIDDKQ